MFAIAMLTNFSTSRLDSIRLTSDGVLCVAGCFGTKRLHQSSSGIMEVSYVPIFFASFIISCLSIPISGLRIGIETVSLIVFMFSNVCDPTCPRLSPVTKACAPLDNAIFSAIRVINLLYIMMRYWGGTESMISFCTSAKGTKKSVEWN